MAIHPIRNAADLHHALARVEALWGAPEGTQEGDELDILLTLIEAYEAKHHEIPAGDPVEVIQFKLKELRLSQNALARRLGWSSGRVSEVLNRRRPLTLAMVRALSEALSVPPGVLVGPEAGPAAHRVAVWLPAGLCERISRDAGADSDDLERAVIARLERGLAEPAQKPAARRGLASGFDAGEQVYLRPGWNPGRHSSLAA